MDLKNAGDIINAAALLQNFIVDERENSEGNNDDATFFRKFLDSTVRSKSKQHNQIGSSKPNGHQQ